MNWVRAINVALDFGIGSCKSLVVMSINSEHSPGRDRRDGYNAVPYIRYKWALWRQRPKVVNNTGKGLIDLFLKDKVHGLLVSISFALPGASCSSVSEATSDSMRIVAACLGSTNARVALRTGRRDLLEMTETVNEESMKPACLPSVHISVKAP